MKQTITFPPIPAETRLLASAMFGKGNVYIRLGESLSEIASELAGDRLALPVRSFWMEANNLRGALLTTIQYAEKLSNRGVIEAVRSRIELKFALHLPLIIHEITPKLLCEFRSQFQVDTRHRPGFQFLLRRQTEIGFFGDNCTEPPLMEEILVGVCTQNRLEEVFEALNLALESLAAAHPSWLRHAALPYWYNRYQIKDPLRALHTGAQAWRDQVLEIGGDIDYLLSEISISGQPDLAALPEIVSLKKIFEEQYEIHLDERTPQPELKWRDSGCLHCAEKLHAGH